MCSLLSVTPTLSKSQFFLTWSSCRACIVTSNQGQRNTKEQQQNKASKQTKTETKIQKAIRKKAKRGGGVS